MGDLPRRIIHIDIRSEGKADSNVEQHAFAISKWTNMNAVSY
jgi:hypothetical protein